MSSDRVATICSARTHNCEGSWLLEDGEWPVAAVLDRFSEFWDLSLPVLMVKSAAASESSYQSLQYTQGSIPDGDVLPIPLDVSHAAPMPPRMVARGIGRLRPAYLMMWRPWCLSPLSSHARDKGAPSSAGWQRFELALNEYQVKTHRVLTSHGESVLVLNYADLLWDVTAARRRIERWAPCAGALDPSVNERLEVQRSGGHWKDAASVTTYAAAHPPAASGYDPRRGACVETLYSDELSADEVRRADEAIAYLSVESRIEVEVPPRPPTPSPPPTPPLPPTTTPLPPPPAPTSHPESHLPELLAAILPFLVAACVLALLCRACRRCRRRKYGEPFARDGRRGLATAPPNCRGAGRAGSGGRGPEEDEEIAALIPYRFEAELFLRDLRVAVPRSRERDCAMASSPRRRLRPLDRLALHRLAAKHVPRVDRLCLPPSAPFELALAGSLCWRIRGSGTVAVRRSRSRRARRSRCTTRRRSRSPPCCRARRAS